MTEELVKNKQTEKRKVLSIVAGISVSVILCGFFFIGGYILGKGGTNKIEIVGANNIETPIAITENSTSTLSGSDNEPADFGIFWEAWAKLKGKYLHSKDVKNQDLVYGAIKGLAEGTGDPYTSFFSPDEAKKFDEDISGEFGGIGAELEKNNGQIIVIAPLKNTPAEKAGLKPKDIILKADSTVLSGKEVEDAIKVIRGEPGTKVKLLVFSENDGAPRDVEITRQIIKIPTVEWEMKDNSIAYLRLYSFNKTSPMLFRNALAEIAQKNPKGLVLDLRNNPGGLLDAAVDMAGWFLDPNTVVVKERHASGEDNVFKSYGNAAFKDIPMVVLVDEGSASASEILAGALRDDAKIKLVGMKTFGKGTVQMLEELSDGSMMKITIANWVTPGGTILEKGGLEPDIKVEITDADLKAKKDSQLDMALKTVLDIINKK